MPWYTDHKNANTNIVTNVVFFVIFKELLWPGVGEFKRTLLYIAIAILAVARVMPLVGSGMPVTKGRRFTGHL
jgi:hypothetical protein